MIVSVDIWEQAAQRWRQRTLERERGRADTDERSRSRMRVGRLTRAAAHEKARALALAAERTGRTVAATVEDFAFERILGKSDLLDANFLELAIAMARSVARIRISGGFGTGFLVSPTLMITNNHVIGDAQQGASATAEFDYQQNRSGDLLPVQSFRLLPQRLFLTSKPLDFTLVAVSPQSDRGFELQRYGWVKLIPEQGKAANGDCINIVQHPRGGLKQIALRENEVVDIFDDFVHYRTDTEPGSSGSPCFNDQWELVALHHSGVPKTDSAGRLLREDGDIWRKGIDPPTRVAWVANEGVRVSSIVRFVEAARMSAEQELLIEELLNATPPNPIELARGSGGPAVQPAAGPSGNTITWTIPVQVTVSLGGASSAVPTQTVSAAMAPQVVQRAMVAAADASSAATVPAETPEERITIDRDYSNRTGYDPDFIPEFAIPLPQMTESMLRNAAVNRDATGSKRHVFDYEHFSVVMNKRRRIAYFSAVNIDGKQKQNLGSRGRDSWSFDTRLDEGVQMGEEVYAGNVLDRGHIVRRLDPVWGRTAKRAHDDTFHFTNCSPQHKTFNQGGELWLGLEDYLLDKAQDEKRRLTVFTGPVLRGGDPLFQSDRMDRPIRIPLEYWKVAALIKADGSKAAAAFLVSQADLIGDARDLLERFEPQTFQVPIADIERLTGLKFGNLREFDTVADRQGLERFEGIDADLRPLARLEEIQL